MPATKKKSVKKTTKQTMVSFGDAIANFWKQYAVFSGTAQRSEFWWWVLFNLLISVSISIAFIFSPLMRNVFDSMWFVATLVPWLALYSRRFHDAGLSSLWFFIPLLAFVILFPTLILMTTVAESELLYGLLGLLVFAWLGFMVFWFVVSLIPSKLKDNKYRK